MAEHPFSLTLARFISQIHPWNALAPIYLGSTAARALAPLTPTELLISDVTLSEVARLLVAGKVIAQGDSARWLATFAAKYTVVPVSADIAWTAAAYAFAHRDPCDRHILATADVLGLPFVTADKELTKAARGVGVSVVW